MSRELDEPRSRTQPIALTDSESREIRPRSWTARAPFPQEPTAPPVEPAGGVLNLPLRVRALERTYLRGRRAAAGVAADQPVIGLAFSGGGIRSATFCLGVSQALSKAGLLKHVDYLSTVSGGGYFGSCLSSYLSHPDTERSEPSTVTTRKSQLDLALDAQDKPPLAPDLWTAQSRARWSVERGSFPFHQQAPLQHLRTHGDFLILRDMLLSRDVLRVVGILLTGLLATLGMFLFAMTAVAALSLVLTRALGGSALWSLLVSEADWQHFASEWLPSGDWNLLLGVFAAGALVGLCAWLVNLKQQAFLGASEGETGDDRSEAHQLSSTMLALAAFPGSVALLSVLRPWLEQWNAPGRLLSVPAFMLLDDAQWLWAPLFFSLGVLMIATLLYATVLPRTARWDLRHRSRLGAVGALGLYGSVVFGFLVCVPPMIWAMYKLNAVGNSTMVALAGLLMIRVLARQPGPKELHSSKLRQLLNRALLAIAVPLVLVATLASLDFALLMLTARLDLWWFPHLACGVALALVGLSGYCVDYNRISPHYFYRDRLAEGFLRTETRTNNMLKLVRDDEQLPLAHLHGRMRERDRRSSYPSGSTTGSRPEVLATLDDAAARICELDRKRDETGAFSPASSEAIERARATWGLVENSAPYHLIVCALNLAGSRDLARRDRKSDHFVFSRLFCGSTSTGYEYTDIYEAGRVELARAMTISGAAAASAAGVHTSTLHAFAATLFNIRLGYWMQNPRVHPHPDQPLDRVVRGASERGIGFWVYYLLCEMFGQTTAQGSMVNLSDGGHTGDNTALCPLLQRRCDVVLVCDAGCDPQATCGDLAAAARIAYVDENVVVEIDTSALRPLGEDASGPSYVIGTIHYPAVNAPEDRDAAPKTGQLIYLKCGLAQPELPIAVRSYAATHPDFPHESTGDQFYDDAQFEAYRSLGEAIATRMIRDMRKGEGAREELAPRTATAAT